MEWSNYVVYAPILTKRPDELTRAEARAEFHWQMTVKDERKAMVGELMEANGFSLGDGTHDPAMIDEFIRVNSEGCGESPEKLSPLWFAVLWDLSFYLGDLLIDRHPGLRWELCEGPKSDVDYHTAVIRGFSVKRPRLGTEFLRFLVGYSLRVLERGDREPQGQVGEQLDRVTVLFRADD